MQGRNRDADVENRYVDIQGEEEGGTNWEIRTDIYTLSCVKRELVGSCCIAQGAQLSAIDDLEGWDGGGRLKRDGLYIHTELIHFLVQQKLAHYEATILQLKKRQCLSSCVPYILKKGIKNNTEKYNNFRVVSSTKKIKQNHVMMTVYKSACARV